MNEDQECATESIILVISKWKKPKMGQRIYDRDEEDSESIISSSEYYFRSNLWLLQSGKDTLEGEV
jgi:hypothetical protein